jgi:sugar lactone lactonase YvrE
MSEEKAHQVATFPNDIDAYCLAVDSQHDVWVTHAYGKYVTKIDADHATPDGAQLATELRIPSGTGVLPGFTFGIAIDSADNVYFASGSFLYKRNPTQCNPPNDPDAPPCLKRVIKAAQNMTDAWPVIVDAADNVYVAGKYTGGKFAVWKVAPSETVQRIFESVATAGNFKWDLAVDASGNVFVSEWYSERVFRIPTTGAPQEIHTNVVYIDGLEVDSQGSLWVSGRSVVKITSSDNWVTWTQTDRTPTGYVDASNSWMGPDDDLYTTGVSRGKVWEWEGGSVPTSPLVDDAHPAGPPIHQYGLDVFGDVERDYLYLSTEQVTSEPYSDASVWRVCENLDNDILCDSQDNCTEADNASQVDADHDGFGNRCDADFDQNGVSGASDYGIFVTCFGKTVGPGQGPSNDPTCAESDLDGSGVVGGADYANFGALFAHAAGPTGLGCATSPPTDGSCP